MTARAFVSAWLLIVLLSIPSAAQQASDPWRIPAGQSRGSLESQYSTYWWENYEWSRETLTRGRDLESKLPQVIDRLRLVIAQEPTSSARKRNPSTREQLEYFPYLYLSMAFAQSGDFAAAAETLDRVNEGEIARTRDLADIFASAKREIVAQRRIRIYVELFEWLEEVRAGRDKIWFSEGGQTTANRLIADAIAKLRDAAPKDQDNVMAPVLRETSKLILSEFALRATKLRKLRAVAWPSATNTGSMGSADSACSSPPDDSTPERLLAVRTKLQDCVAKTDAAIAELGRTACEDLSQLNANSLQRAESLRKLGGSPPATANLPAACGTNWAAGFGSVHWAAVDDLDYETFAVSLRDAIQQSETKIAGLRREKLGELAAVRDLVPDLPRECVRELQLGEPARKLDALRAQIDDAMETGNSTAGGGATALRQQLETDLKALAARAQSKVQLLMEEKDSCEGVQPAAFTGLPDLGRALTQQIGSRQIRALCDGAIAARNAIDACWSQDIDAVRAKANGFAWILAAADRWNEASGTPVDCLAQSTAEIAARSRSTGSGQAWISQTRKEIETAQLCIGRYREQRTAWVQRIEESVALGVTVGGDSGRFAELGEAFQSGQELLDRVGDLLRAEPEDLDPATLRQRLGATGLEANVPAEHWSGLTTLRGADQAVALAAIRDEALDPALLPVANRVERWAPMIGKVRAYRLLTRVFGEVGSGRLDAAIAELRQSQQAGQFPGSGRPAAMGHAALSYALYCKWIAAQGDDPENEARRALFDDASTEAQRAVAADGAFEPSSTLFTHSGFRDFYSNCCSNP